MCRCGKVFLCVCDLLCYVQICWCFRWQCLSIKYPFNLSKNMYVHRIRLKYLMLLISEAFSRLPYSFDFQTGFEIKFLHFWFGFKRRKTKATICRRDKENALSSKYIADFQFTSHIQAIRMAYKPRKLPHKVTRIHWKVLFLDNKKPRERESERKKERKVGRSLTLIFDIASTSFRFVLGI